MEHPIRIIFFRIIILLPVLWCINISEVSATHIVGGNLTYKHISGDLYEVKVVLRRDCFLGSPEAEFDDPASVGIFTAGGSLAIWLANNGQIKMPFMSSDTLNQFIRSDCGFEGTQVCVHETTYRGLVNLPDRPGGYYLVYQRCCRNGSLSNIIDPLETGGTYWALITEEALNLRNSTPEFKAWPDVYICANKPHDFDHSATDRDGDSLVYKLCTPSSGATKAFPRPQPPGFPPYDNILWRSPYGLLDMMGGIPLKIDSKTGKITATPNLVGQFLIGICVDEYRNGVKIGSVRRDCQYNVRVCSQPPLARFTTTETNCDGLTVEFFNTSLSASGYEWNFNYPSNDTTFKSTAQSPKFTFPSIGTYNVRLRATRGSDGCFDTILQKVIIFNNKITPEFDFSLSDCNQSKDSLKIILNDKSIFDEPGYSINFREWLVTQNGITKKYNGSSVTANLSYGGDISVTLNVGANNGCQATITNQIKSEDIRPKADFKIDYPSCPVNDVVKIRLISLAKELNPFAKVISSQWTIGNLKVTGDTVIVDIPYSADSVSVSLLTNFQGSCAYTFTKKIKLLAPPSADFSMGSEVCGGLNVSFKNNSTNADTFLWNFNHPSADPIFRSNVKDPAFSYTTSGKYNVQLIATRTTDGCRDTIIKEVGAFENKIKADFSVLLTNCERYQDSLGIRLTDLSATNEAGQAIVLREWTITQNGISKKLTGTNADFNVSLAGDITITLKVTSSNSCTATTTKNIKYEDIRPKADFKIDYPSCPVNDVVKIRLINLAKDLNPFAKVISSQWTIGNLKITGDTVIVDIPYSADSVSVSLLTNFQGSCAYTFTKKIKLLAPPSADFSMGSEVCGGLNVSFTNNSTNADTFLWNFNHPSADPIFRSNVKDPAFSYTTSGKYNVQLIATRTTDGCRDTVIKEVGAFENKIKADFSVLLTNCERYQDSLGIRLTDLSATNEAGQAIVLREWTITQNGISKKLTGTNADFNVSLAGDITITLKVTSSNGCTATITKNVKSEDIRPKTDFKIDYPACPINDVVKIRLINLAKDLNPFAKVTSSQWTIGNLKVTGDTAVVDIPFSSDSISVNLLTTFQGFCTYTFTKKIKLLTPPSADFNMGSEVCSGLNVSFKNNSTNADTYVWNFNHPSADPLFRSNVKDPSFAYTTSGKYNVQLIATRTTDGCRDTIIKEVGAFENNIKADFSVLLTNCERFQDSLGIRLTDLSATNEAGQNIVLREWTITQNGLVKKVNGANPEINLALSGDITIVLKVTASNGCTATATKIVKSDDLVPELDFKVEPKGCPRKDTIDLMLINLSGQKNPFAQIQDTRWTIGNKMLTGDSVIISVPYNASGIGIMLENSFNGNCRKSLVKNIPLIAPALAAFNVTSGECSGFNVAFENKSTGAVSFEWYFNYPDTSSNFRSNLISPSFIYSKDGLYQVKLKATRADGCFDTIIRSIPAFENKIRPQFNIRLNGCDPATDKLSITLSDNSAFDQPGHSINAWEWTVNQNGKVSKYAGKIVDILLSYTGGVEITLEVSSSNNCTAKKTQTYKIEDFIPKADFELSLISCPTDDVAEIKLKNLAASLNPFAKVDSSLWVVNSQKFVGDSIIVRLPKNTTTFDVALTTYFNKECKIITSKTLSLQNILPKAAYQYKGVECPTDELIKISLSFVDSLSRNIPLGSINWQVVAGGTVQSLSGTPVNLNVPKDSLVKLDFTAAFTNGCTDRVQTSFLPGPYASLKFDSEPLVLCPGESKYLVKNSNPSWTYTWSPITGLDFTEPKNPKVSVNSNTKYFITVTDGLCTVRDSIQVILLSAGVELKIDADNFTCDGNVSLKGSGGVGSGTYTWSKSEDFTDIIGRSQNITSSFTGIKQDFYLKFEGTTCSTKPAKITINNETPNVLKLSPIDLCPSDTSQIFTLNENAGHINNYSWKNDPHIINGGNTGRPTIAIGSAERDSFILNYTVINQFNCKLEDSIKVRVKQSPTMNFDIQLKECGKYEVCFKLERTNYQGFIQWDFGDPTTLNDRSLDNAPCYTYKSAGIYNIRLSNLTSTCPFIPIMKPVTLNPQVILAPVRDTVICKGSEISLNASSNLQNIRYEWFDTNGKLLFTGQKYTAKYNSTSKVVLKGSDAFNCTDSVTINVNVFEFKFDIEAKDSLCVDEPSQIKLNIQNPSQYAINWSPLNKIISGGNTATPTITASDSILYKVVLRHIATGCIDSTTFKPKVTKPFVFTVKAPDLLCLDVPTEVTLTIANPSDYTFDWSPKDCVASGGNTVNPKIKISKDKILTVKVTNKVSGCSQSMNVNVKAADKVDVTIDAIPDLTIFEGDSVDLVIKNPVNTSKYVWSTGSTSTTINVSPIITTTYSSTVTDRNGCTAETQATVIVKNAKCDETDVYLPNAFSPNNDGNNDVFRLRSNFIDEMELIIYNRWGQEVFRTKDDQEGWDGTFKGQELPPDAYAYFLRVICINQGVFTKRGNVNLLR